MSTLSEHRSSFWAGRQTTYISENKMRYLLYLDFILSFCNTTNQKNTDRWNPIRFGKFSSTQKRTLETQFQKRNSETQIRTSIETRLVRLFFVAKGWKSDGDRSPLRRNMVSELTSFCTWFCDFVALATNSSRDSVILWLFRYKLFAEKGFGAHLFVSTRNLQGRDAIGYESQLSVLPVYFLCSLRGGFGRSFLGLNSPHWTNKPADVQHSIPNVFNFLCLASAIKWACPAPEELEVLHMFVSREQLTSLVHSLFRTEVKIDWHHLRVHLWESVSQCVVLDILWYFGFGILNFPALVAQALDISTRWVSGSSSFLVICLFVLASQSSLCTVVCVEE